MKRTLFTFILMATLCGCGKQENATSQTDGTLRIATEEDPQTLDPRLARTLTESTVMRMLYEGLMRVNSQGVLENALAEEIIVSPDLKTYQIRLKESMWSDGTPVTAEDFVETWKSMLDPNFPSPIASQLFIIKGAKEAKEGSAPLDAIALKTLSPLGFIMELTQPIAYFSELMVAFPVHKRVREGTVSADPKAHVYNGPFTLDEWSHHHRIVFGKNKNYWDKASVNLSGVQLEVVDGPTALTLFRHGQLDWIGSPLSTLPQDAIPSLRDQGLLEIARASGTYWFRFNTEKAPTSDRDMRLALNLALNRSDIVRHITQGNQEPALGILPPPMTLKEEGYYKDNQTAEARKRLDLALSHSGVSREDFPAITLCYGNNERNHKIAQAVQQQWQSALGIAVNLQALEAKVAFDQVAKGNYQVMLGSWFADINDPINFLNVFKAKGNGTNHTRWEDSHYAALLDMSNVEVDPAKRRTLMVQAEGILMDAMPVAPLFHNTYNFVKNDSVKGVYFSELGYLDFKGAQIRTDKQDKSHDE